MRDYTEGYYAAFVRDPDGNKLEAVHLPYVPFPRSDPRGQVGVPVGVMTISTRRFCARPPGVSLLATGRL